MQISFAILRSVNRRRRKASEQMENGVAEYVALVQHISRFSAGDDDDAVSVHDISKQVSHAKGLSHLHDARSEPTHVLHASEYGRLSVNRDALRTAHCNALSVFSVVRIRTTLTFVTFLEFK
jgi:hypothetical protein